jgi:GAF domain/PilZ domain/Sel1 repeat
VRHRVQSPAYASLNGSSQGSASDLSEILDLSEDGMSIQTSSALEVDRDLNFSLDLSETKAHLHAPGQVVWSDSSGRAGIRFAKLSGQTLRQVKEWLFVNALTAYDHARAWTAHAGNDESGGDSNGRLRYADSAQNGSLSEPRVSSGKGDRLMGREVVQREMDLGDYGPEASLQSIAEWALSATRATGGAIAVSEGEEMICLASAGSDAPPIGCRLQIGSGFSGECVRTGRTLRCDDSETDDRVDREGCRGLGIRSMVAVPVRLGNRVVGLLEVFSPQPYGFNAKDTGMLQQLAGTILSAMGHGVETPAAPGEAPEAPPTRIQPAPIEEYHSADVLAGTMAAVSASPHRRLQKVLLFAAVVTLVFALLWLVAPWVTSRIRQSSRAVPPVQESSAPVSQPHSLPVDVNDLAGVRRLAERGDPAAQFALGARYATGEEVKQDYSEAVRWFTQAAERGHIIAQATLGAYYWAGRGVPQNLTKAYFWSVLAQAGGDQASKYRVAVLASRMTRNQVLAAQEQANDWLRNHQMAGNIPPSQ